MNKSCFNFFPVIETERLILRQINSLDVEDIFEIFSDAEVAKYEWFTPMKSHEDAMKFISRYRDEFEDEEEITWGIVLKENNKLIGTCCLGDFAEGARRCEIGYDIMQAEWNNGYATEAIKAVVDFAFKTMNLNRIEAFITPGNDASVSVLKKVGFIHEGIVRERDLIKGKLEDGIVMAILKRDYALLQNKSKKEQKDEN